MDEQWARERIRQLMGATEPLEAAPTMEVNINGIRVTVSGKCTVLVIAPGLTPGQAGEEPKNGQ